MEEDVVEVTGGEFLSEDVCWIFEKETKREVVLRVYEKDKSEAVGEHSLTEKRCVEVEALSCDGDGVLEKRFGECKIGEERDELTGVALDEGKSDRRDEE